MMRLTALELENFKNVRHGRIGLSNCTDGSCFDNSDIIGIYGQNGSGKTSVIAALFILKALFQGEELPEGLTEECVAVNSDSFTIRCEGVIEDEAYPFVPWRYEVTVGLKGKTGAAVWSEKVWCRRFLSEKPSMTAIFDYRKLDGSYELAPKSFWGSIGMLDKGVSTRVAVAQALADERGASFFFSEDLYRCLSESFEPYRKDRARDLPAKGHDLYGSHGVYLDILRSELGLFALKNMVVLPPSTQIYSIIDQLAIFTHEGRDGKLADACFQIDTAKPIAVEADTLKAVEGTIEVVDRVLAALVPGLSVSIARLGTTLLDDGERAERIEVVATRNGVTVPLRCESEGIKRLVSILNLLVDVYANPSACVAIDELDAGIFEYLLGEILQVLEERGKGQLIFTAHNLRPLETISKKSIVFTTTNPDNRYIPFKGLKASNNLRKQYLRAVYLGGQDEEIYEPTSKFAIDNAFYDAGVSLGVER